MSILSFLRGFVVVGRRSKYCIHTLTTRRLSCFRHRLSCGVRGCACDDWHSARCNFHDKINYPQPFMVRKGRRFCGRTTSDNKIDSGFDLPCDELAQDGFIDRTILLKRRDKCSSTSAEFHFTKIARIGGRAKGGKWLQFAPDILEVVEAPLSQEPFGR